MKIIPITLMSTLLAIAPPLFAGGYDKHGRHHGGDRYDTAQVIDVEPLYRQVRVSVPEQECWEERVQRTVYRDEGGGNSAGGMILGGIIGGVIGRQFDIGHDRQTGTIAGSLIGASIGHDVSHRNSRRVIESSGDDYVTRCKTVRTHHSEERIDGYQVTYRYHGNVYTTRMPYDPGREIRVKVDVTPLHH